MKKLLVVFFAVLMIGVGIEAGTKYPVVRMETNKGDVILELYSDKAPVSVENFLAYTKEGFYNGTIFHRVIKDFMVQGGGFVTGLKQRRPSRVAIENEAHNKIENKRGTVAMARTSVIDSATAQFFINLVDNDFLNYRNNTRQGYGYAVFGKVISGMDIIDEIGEVKTTRVGQYMDVPREDVVIKKVVVLRMPEKKKAKAISKPK